MQAIDKKYKMKDHELQKSLARTTKSLGNLCTSETQYTKYSYLNYFSFSNKGRKLEHIY